MAGVSLAERSYRVYRREFKSTQRHDQPASWGLYQRRWESLRSEGFLLFERVEFAKGLIDTSAVRAVRRDRAKMYLQARSEAKTLRDVSWYNKYKKDVYARYLQPVKDRAGFTTGRWLASDGTMCPAMMVREKQHGIPEKGVPAPRLPEPDTPRAAKRSKQRDADQLARATLQKKAEKAEKLGIGQKGLDRYAKGRHKE